MYTVKSCSSMYRVVEVKCEGKGMQEGREGLCSPIVRVHNRAAAMYLHAVGLEDCGIVGCMQQLAATGHGKPVNG